MLVKVTLRLASKGADTYGMIQQNVIYSRVIGTDETGEQVYVICLFRPFSYIYSDVMLLYFKNIANVNLLYSEFHKRACKRSEAKQTFLDKFMLDHNGSIVDRILNL